MVEHRYSDLFLTAREALRPTQGENAAQLRPGAAGCRGGEDDGGDHRQPGYLRPGGCRRSAVGYAGPDAAR